MEVSFSAVPPAGMAVMACRVVAHVEPLRRKSGFELRPYGFRDRNLEAFVSAVARDVKREVFLSS